MVENTIQDEPFRIRVECYSGYRGEETPRALYLGEKKIAVSEVIDRWLAPAHRYFKIIGDDKGLYIVRHDSVNFEWELTFYKCCETDRTL
ncbi:MAG: hypothetical protein V2I97_00695 [Desulfococcaceae bacterium]|jgi:hypothetical protein|nr:hypothetical protein [Desulfococcaceae bacterium]